MDIEMENKNESLTYTKKSAFDLWDSEKLAAAMNYSAGYMKAVDRAKTEREAVEWTTGRRALSRSA